MGITQIVVSAAKAVTRKICVLFRILRLRGKVRIERFAMIDMECIFEGGNKLAYGSRLVASSLGRGTYVGDRSLIINSRIGRYCSIGSRVIVVKGRHPINMVSTHPAFYSLRRQSGFTYTTQQRYEEYKYADENGKHEIVIGNDVWIGADCRLIGGITIGDGAVILAGAVVTKDVAPYAIVGGVPAKLLRFRFDDEVVEKLLKIKWWTKSEAWLRAHCDYFTDPCLLLEYIENENPDKS